MRSLIPPVVFAACLLATTAAIAAPTCQTRFGDTARCGTAGVMPVGWRLAAGERAGASAANTLSPVQWFGLITLVGGLFALIALMPDFDGWGHEGDDNEEQT